MNIRTAGGLMAAIAIAIFSGSFAGGGVLAARADDQENHQQSQATMENKAAEIGKKLDELDQKLKTAGEEAKADMSRQMVELRKMQKDIQEKLREMKSSSGKAWQDAKAGAQSALDDLKKAYEKARMRFGHSTE